MQTKNKHFLTNHFPGNSYPENYVQPLMKSDAFTSDANCADPASFHLNSLAQHASTHILIVEDNEFNQLLATRILTLLNCVPHIASNGKTAMAMLAERTYQMVLMDLRMPEMDGFEAATQIRKHPDPLVRSIPIIAMTASNIDQDIEKCERAGMNDYINKPLNIDELTGKISTWITTSKNPTATYLPVKNNNSKYSDLSYLRSLCCNDTDFMKEMLHSYITRAKQFMDSMDIAIASQDYQTINTIVHKMQSANLIVGIEALKVPMHKIEFYTDENYGLDEIPDLMGIVKVIMKQSVTELETELKSL
jgi:CheY-like chemotaxis protein